MWKTLNNEGIQEPERAIKGGWLQTTLIDHILERANVDGKRFKDIEDIAQAFILDLFGEATEIESSVQVHLSSSSTVVEYDEHGSAIAVAKLILQKEGFEVDKRYHSPKRQLDKLLRPSEAIARKLISMADDGTSTLQAYSHIGELMVDKFTTVIGEELSAKFVPYGKVFKSCTKYPSNEGRHCTTLLDDVLADRV